MKLANKTTLAAAVALTATVGLALPAAADSYSGYHTARVRAHHAVIRADAYRAGYRHGFRDGHYAAAYGQVPDEGPVVTGRSAYVAPGAAYDPGYGYGYGEPGYDSPGLLGQGGLLGTGVGGGNGVLGTGVLDGRGALGLGVLGF